MWAEDMSSASHMAHSVSNLSFYYNIMIRTKCWRPHLLGQRWVYYLGEKIGLEMFPLKEQIACESEMEWPDRRCIAKLPPDSLWVSRPAIHQTDPLSLYLNSDSAQNTHTHTHTHTHREIHLDVCAQRHSHTPDSCTGLHVETCSNTHTHMHWKAMGNKY